MHFFFVFSPSYKGDLICVVKTKPPNHTTKEWCYLYWYWDFYKSCIKGKYFFKNQFKMTLRLFFLIINIYLFLGFQPESAPHNLHPGKTLSTVCEAVCLLCSLAILCKMLNFLPLPRWVCLSDSITQKLLNQFSQLGWRMGQGPRKSLYWHWST